MLGVLLHVLFQACSGSKNHSTGGTLDQRGTRFGKFMFRMFGHVFDRRCPGGEFHPASGTFD